MNERIREFAEQAYPHDNNVNIWRHHEKLEKFAELIVRECGRVYIQNQQDGVMTLTEDLLHHLGVKE